MTITAEAAVNDEAQIAAELRAQAIELRARAMVRAADRWMGRFTETPNGHWPWPGQLAGDGSPVCQIGIGGRQVSTRANRLLWEVLVGPIPDGHVLRSLCDHPACVNPACHEAMPRAELARLIDTPMGTNARKESCIRDHPLSGPGSDVYKRRNGGRQCRACDRERERTVQRTESDDARQTIDSNHKEKN